MSLYEYERNGDAQELIRVLRSSDNEEIRRRAAELLGRLVEHEDRHDIVRALIRAATTDTDRVAGTAVDALDELGDGALEELITELADVDLDTGAEWTKATVFAQALDARVPELRMAAASALGNLDYRESVGALVRALEDPDPRVRLRAARACGEIGDPRAVGALSERLDDEATRVRLEAAEALGRIGSPRAMDALLAVADDPDERVRRVAVSSFGTFGHTRAVGQLVTALDDDSPAVRRAAVFSLVEVLTNVPAERSHEVRETLIEHFGATDDTAVITPLAALLREAREPPQRRNAAWLLGRTMDAESDYDAVDALVDALGDSDRLTRQFAAASLAEIGGTYVESAVTPLVHDDGVDEEVRAQARFVLGAIGGATNSSGGQTG